MMLFSEETLDITPRGGAAEDASMAAPNSARSEPSSQVQNTELHTLRADHAKLQQAIFEAAQVQRRLCAPRALGWRQFEVAGEIFPVRHLCGDFFKVMQLRTGLGLVLGDIAGKGLTAGIWQTYVMALIQRAARNHADPGAAVREVNRELCRDQGGPPLTALFYARIDGKTNELLFCNAGVPAPLLLRANQTLELLEEGGPMLGAVPKGVFNTGRVQLHPGDLLVAYSDGVTECRNPQDQEFETHRLAAAARTIAGASAPSVLFGLLGAVLDFADSCAPGDDLSLLVLRRKDVLQAARPGSRARSKKFPAPHRRTGSAAKPGTPDRGEHRSE